MTIAAFASLKGAPGVTTLACLVGAGWPQQRKVMVVECDPSGGDLAARFRLSSRVGWPSLISSARRSGWSEISVGSHLQQLPGGLDVLVGTTGMEPSESKRAMAALLSGANSSLDGPWDVLVDLGRLLPDDLGSRAWLDHCDAVVIGLRSDAASVVQVREKAIMVARWTDRLGLAILGTGCHSSVEIGGFTGIPVVGEIPFDPRVAAVAAGEQSGGRRLSRSLLVTAAHRLAATLAGGPLPPGSEHIAMGPEPSEEDGAPPHAGALAPLGSGVRWRTRDVIRARVASSSSRQPSTDSRRQGALG
jgi:hypothetical protein